MDIIKLREYCPHHAKQFKQYLSDKHPDVDMESLDPLAQLGYYLEYIDIHKEKWRGIASTDYDPNKGFVQYLQSNVFNIFNILEFVDNEKVVSAVKEQSRTAPSKPQT